MSGKDGHVIAQRKELLPNSLEKKVFIASGQIPAPHATRKQNISTDQDGIRPIVEAETSWTVSRHLQDLEVQAEESAVLSLVDEEIRFSRLDFKAESKSPEVIGIGNHRFGFGMATDGAAKCLLDPCYVLYVIDVPVGQD